MHIAVTVLLFVVVISCFFLRFSMPPPSKPRARLYFVCACGSAVSGVWNLVFHGQSDWIAAGVWLCLLALVALVLGIVEFTTNVLKAVGDAVMGRRASNVPVAFAYFAATVVLATFGILQLVYVA